MKNIDGQYFHIYIKQDDGKEYCNGLAKKCKAGDEKSCNLYKKKCEGVSLVLCNIKSNQQVLLE